MPTTDKQPASRVLAAIASELWAITEPALESIIAIAERKQSDIAAVEAVLAKRGEPLAETRRVEVRDGVAIVPVIGPIVRYANIFSEISGGTSLESLATDFGAAVDNAAVKAIVLNIDSPGGQANGISEFAAQVRAANSIKPVAAYIGGTGASAAYWIASAAGEVVVSETAVIGSVGTIARVARNESDGSVTFVSSQSPRKQADPGSDVGRADWQALVDTHSRIFIDSVAKYRGVSVATVLEDFGQGFVKVGQDAVDADMVDAVGSLEQVIAGLAGSTQKPRGIAMTHKTTTVEASAITVAYITANHPDIAEALRAEGVSSVQIESVTAALIREKHGDIAAELYAEGATAERERIQAVHAQALPGYEALIAEMVADGKTTGPEAAMRILQAEKKTREDQLGGIKSDAALLDGKAPAAAPPAGSTDRSHLPLDERCQAEWQENAELRAEYGDKFESYLAFERAKAAGKVRFSSAKK